MRKSYLSSALNTNERAGQDLLGSIAINFELANDGTAPARMMLLPAGPQIVGRDGRHWTMHEPEALVAAFAANNADLPIDVEHSTELKAPYGEPAPAMAWISALQVVNGAIWGDVQWNQEGRELISGKKYRYISPVFHYDKKSLAITRLTSAGLTNQPNLGLPALNRQQAQEKDIMKKIYLKLGLPETATEDQALNAISALQTDLATAKNRAETPSLDKFVPRGDYDLALNRATAAETKLADHDKAQTETAINAVIDKALAAGKIAPASKDFYTASCRAEGGLDAFEKFIETAPTIAKPSGLDGREHQDSTALNAEQLQIAAMFGNTVEDLKKYGQA